jgi:phospholipid/cholesterol/gamma-HCH transport system permease protein
MEGYELTIKGDSDIRATLAGRLVIGNAAPFMKEMEQYLIGRRPATVTCELAGLVYLDSAGALALLKLQDSAKSRNFSLTYNNMSREAQEIMDLIDRDALVKPPLHEETTSRSFPERTGDAAVHFYEDLISLLTFLGELLAAIAHCIVHPGAVRWGDVFFYMKRAGAEALPIVGLISLLIGLIMAFMSSLQLKQFGANIFVASLVGISIVKELGPIMTAIIFSGRSGSAFAAEIATMMVNEEVDALTTMGFDPLRFLVIPKVLASIAVVPVLTLYSMFFGILGGLLVGIIGLDLTFYTYLQQTMKPIEVFDLASSLVKSVVFAVLIAGIGCQRGFQVRGGAEAVGEATTSAVVASIFLVIVADSAFAVVLQYLR